MSEGKASVWLLELEGDEREEERRKDGLPLEYVSRPTCRQNNRTDSIDWLWSISLGQECWVVQVEYLPLATLHA